MPAAKKASQSKTARKAVKASPKVKAKAPVRQGKAKLTLVGKSQSKKTTAPPGRKEAKGLRDNRTAGEPRNIIMELWKAKEEKHRNEVAHTKFHWTGPPGSKTANAKHEKFARFSGPRRRAS